MKRDVNFSTQKPVGHTFLTSGKRYDKFGRKRETNYWVNFCVTRWFYALFTVIIWLGISTLSQLIGLENFIWCLRRTDFAEIIIPFKAPSGFAIHRLEVK